MAGFSMNKFNETAILAPGAAFNGSRGSARLGFATWPHLRRGTAPATRRRRTPWLLLRVRPPHRCSHGVMAQGDRGNHQILGITWWMLIMGIWYHMTMDMMVDEVMIILWHLIVVLLRALDQHGQWKNMFHLQLHEHELQMKHIALWECYIALRKRTNDLNASDRSYTMTLQVLFCESNNHQPFLIINKPLIHNH